MFGLNKFYKTVNNNKYANFFMDFIYYISYNR